MLFESHHQNIKSINLALYEHLKKYRGYEAKTELHWWDFDAKSVVNPNSVIPIALELSPLSHKDKLILKFKYQVFNNTLYPYREPAQPINRVGGLVGTGPKATDYLKPQTLTTQVYYTNSGLVDFQTSRLEPENFEQSIKVLKAGFIKKNEFEVDVESEGVPIFLVLETDRGSQIFIKGEPIRGSAKQIRFTYKFPNEIAAQSVLFDHFITGNSQIVYASEGYRLKIPHLKYQINSLEILSRDIDIQDQDETQLKIKVKMLVQSKSPIHAVNLNLKTVTEVINSELTRMGHRAQSSHYRIDQHQIEISKKQMRQKRLGDHWLIEIDFIDHKIATERVEDAEGRSYRVFPIISEDSGDRWITEVSITNEQLENFREFDADGLIRYNNKNFMVNHNSRPPKLLQNLLGTSNRCADLLEVEK